MRGDTLGDGGICTTLQCTACPAAKASQLQIRTKGTERLIKVTLSVRGIPYAKLSHQASVMRTRQKSLKLFTSCN